MSTQVRRYWIPATALNTLGWSAGDVELVQATDFDAALAREAVLEDTIDKLSLAFDSRVKTVGQLLIELTAAEQRNANQAESIKKYQDRNEELVELLREISDYLNGSIRNAVWCDSILHKKMRAALNHSKSGATNEHSV